MVLGLFPKHEQGTVLSLFADSLVFLTPKNIESVLRESNFLSTKWDLANLYLASIGAEPLGKVTENGDIAGLSDGTRFYVSLEYFNCNERFADYVVHEAAHVFHNCKRVTAGLPEMRKREWLLNIRFRDRETFAYCCEAYSRILELGRTKAERGQLLAELEEIWLPSDARVDKSKCITALKDAIAARNGWKVILSHCSEKRTQKRMGPGGTPFQLSGGDRSCSSLVYFPHRPF